MCTKYMKHEMCSTIYEEQHIAAQNMQHIMYKKVHKSELKFLTDPVQPGLFYKQARNSLIK